MFTLRRSLLCCTIFGSVIVRSLPQKNVQALDEVAKYTDDDKKLLSKPPGEDPPGFDTLKLSSREVDERRRTKRRTGKQRKRGYREHYKQALADVNQVKEILTDPYLAKRISAEEMMDIVSKYTYKLELLLDKVRELKELPEFEEIEEVFDEQEMVLEQALDVLKGSLKNSKRWRRKKGTRGVPEMLLDALRTGSGMVGSAVKATTDVASDWAGRGLQATVDLMDGISNASKTVIYGVDKADKVPDYDKALVAKKKHKTDDEEY